MPVQCPYCPKWLANEEAVNRHIPQSERCRRKRQRTVFDITLSDRLYDPYDAADIPCDDEPPAGVVDAMGTISADDYIDVSFNETPHLPDAEEVDFDVILDETDDATTEDVDDLAEGDIETETPGPTPYTRSKDPIVEEHPTAASTLGYAETKFEARRRKEEADGEDGWGSLMDQTHHELAEWLLGSGLSQAKMQRYFELEASRRGDLKWKNLSAFLKSVDSLDSGPAWKCRLIPISGDLDKGGNRQVEWVELWYRDIVQCHAELLANPDLAEESTYKPRREYTDETRTVREYSEAMTGDWVWQTQDKLPNGATLDPVILSSDKTQLSQFSGDKSAWPLYTSSGIHSKSARRKPSKHATMVTAYLPCAKLEHINDKDERSRIQATLFHDCMSIVTKPLIKAGLDGVEMICGDGFKRLVHPILMSYVADFPEQCLIASTLQSHCPMCDANHRNRGDLPEPGDSRTFRTQRAVVDAIQAKIDDNRKTRNFERFGLKPVEPFFSELPFVELGTLFTPDLLHQIHKGCFRDHLVSWFQKLMGNPEFDRRYKAVTPYPGMRHFKKGISSISQWTGKEYKEMEKVFIVVIAGAPGVPREARIAAVAMLHFIYLSQLPCQTDRTMRALERSLRTFHENKHIFLDKEACKDFHAIPKLHSIEHYTLLIQSKGSPDGYSTEAPERLHIEFAKKAYRASNRHEFLQQMVKWLRRQEAMNLARSYLAWRLKYRPPSLADDPEPPDMDTTGITDDTLDENMALPPLVPHISNPLALGHGLGYKLAKKPQYPNCDMKTLIEAHGALDFKQALENALEKLDYVNVAKQLNFSHDLFDVWSRIQVALPPVRDLSSSTPYQVINAAPSHVKGWRKKAIPAEFGTALVPNDDEVNPEGLKSFQVVQVRVIFKLPSRFRNLQHLRFAYVEVFTPLREVAEWDGLYVTKRSMRNGKRHARVIPLSDVRLGCHLMGAVMGKMKDTWDTNTVLEKANSFHLNTFSSLLMYILANHSRL